MVERVLVGCNVRCLGFVHSVATASEEANKRCGHCDLRPLAELWLGLDLGNLVGAVKRGGCEWELRGEGSGLSIQRVTTQSLVFINKIKTGTSCQSA